MRVAFAKDFISVMDRYIYT